MKPTPHQEAKTIVDKFISIGCLFANAIDCAILLSEEMILWMPNKTDWNKSTIYLIEANGDNPDEFEWDERHGKQFWREVKNELLKQIKK